MDSNKFRIRYSELIEVYQWIEYSLKGICSALDMDGSTSKFCANLESLNGAGLRCMEKKIKDQENILKKNIIDKELFKKIETLRVRRNYWCHSCFVDIVYEKLGNPRQKCVVELMNDYNDAECVRDSLDEIKRLLLMQNRG